MSKQCLVLTGGTSLLGRSILQYYLQEPERSAVVLTRASKLDIVSSEIHKRFNDKSVKIIAYADNTYSINDAASIPADAKLIHLSAISRYKEDDISSTSEMLNHNIRGSYLLIRSLLDHGIGRVMTIGSAWEHAFPSESHQKYFNLYAIAKSCLYDLCKYESYRYATPYCHVSLYDNFGKDDGRRKIVDIIAHSIINGVEEKISPACQYIDLCPVHYQAALLCRFIEEDKECYNRHTRRSIVGYRVQLRDLIQIIQDIFGVKSKLVIGGRPYRDNEIMMPLVHDQPILYDDIRLPAIKESLLANYFQQ